VNEVALQRGDRAGLLSPSAPLEPDGRAALQHLIDGLYSQFRQVVLAGRGIEAEQFEAVAGGRVWLGRQALERRLVDQLGDLTQAIEKARELARVRRDRWTPVAWISSGRGAALPPPFPAQGWLQDLASLLDVTRPGAWFVSPFEIEIK
jgi:protease-4